MKIRGWFMFVGWRLDHDAMISKSPPVRKRKFFYYPKRWQSLGNIYNRKKWDKKSERIRKGFIKVLLRYYASFLPHPRGLPVAEEIRQIVVFGDMGIGNFIMFTPLLRVLREYFYKSEIVVIFMKCRGGNEVAKRLNSIDRCIFLDVPVKPTLRALGKIYVELKKQGIEQPDVVVGRFSGSSYVPILTGLLRGKWRVGHCSSAGYEAFMDRIFNYPVPMERKQHEIERNLDLARRLGVPISKTQIEFPIYSDERREALDISRACGIHFEKLVCLQIGSSQLQPWKRWPAESWRHLIVRLSERDIQLSLLGSADERKSVDEIVSEYIYDPSIINLCGKMTLGATADFLRRSRLLICNDSGLMHIGAAVGIPIIGIFGPTEYERTRPYAEKFIAMRGRCHCNAGTLFDRLTVAKIEQCDRPCLNSICAEKVAQEAFKILGISYE